jgi:hypothetical protein
MRINKPATFCTQCSHEFLSARKTASLYAGVPLSFSRSISVPAIYSRCLNGKSERPSRARTEVRNSVKESSYSCNAPATSALPITVFPSRCHAGRCYPVQQSLIFWQIAHDENYPLGAPGCPATAHRCSRRGRDGAAIPLNMKRRAFLTLSAGGVALVLAGQRLASAISADGHEAVARRGLVGLSFADLNPDRMWPTYRRYCLLIVSPRDDDRSGGRTAAVVDVLLRHLPSSRPQLVRAADSRRIGLLIATDQQDVAIMQAQSAEALFLGKPPFDDIPDAPLRIIVSFGSHVFVCRPKFHGASRLSVSEDVGRKQ